LFRVIVITLLLAVVGSTAAVSAQAPDRGRADSSRSIVGDVESTMAQRGYTATDDLWQWREQGSRQIIESRTINSTLSYTDSFGQIGVHLIDMRHQMTLEIRPAPGSNRGRGNLGDDRAPREMTVTGRASATQDWFVPDVDDEVLLRVGTLAWDARIEGRGLCSDGQCDLDFELSGALSTPDGRSSCGAMSLVYAGGLDLPGQVMEFKALSGMGGVHELVAIGRAEFNVAGDGSTCLKKGVDTVADLIGNVEFTYGDVGNDGPFTIDRPNRVMPGDNVKLVYRDIPVNFEQPVENWGDQLWDPELAPVQMLQDMTVEIGLREDELILIGDVRGEFPSGVLTSGIIRGHGTRAVDGSYEISMTKGFEFTVSRVNTGCLSMELDVTAYYTPGNDRVAPSWTFGTDGNGKMVMIDDILCALTGGH
jgi:hypothetical protein